MTKAEEWALKHFPVEMELVAIGPDGKPVEVDANRYTRYIAKKVYEMAEKDFTFSPEDVAKIFNKVRDLQVKYPATEACFEEVAEWFNNLKEEKK